MRLKDIEIEAIKAAFVEVFGEGQIYLFGSRVDDNKKGGDIDLYLCPKEIKDISGKKIDFLVKLKREIGDQKIDVVIGRGFELPIEKIAKHTGVMLWKS